MHDVDAAPGGAIKLRLSVMMFLQYGIWGAWLPILYPFLLGHRAFSLDEVGAILAAGAAGAILGPFIAGQVADRWFSTERFLGASHLVGAGLVFFLASVDDFWTFLGISVVYGIVYAPTIALTNSLSFHHLPNRDKDFGAVRVWGTVGWIAVGIAVGQWLLLNHTPVDGAVIAEEIAQNEAAQNAGRADAFILSAALGVVMGLYCFTLPRTPPVKSDTRSNAWAGALAQLRKPTLMVLFLISVPVSIVHQFYFVHAAGFLTKVQNQASSTGLSDAINKVLGVGGGGLMTIGQMTEIAVLAAMPILATMLTRKSLLMIGLIAYALRMALFAYLPEIHGALGVPEIGIAIAGVALHGLCFGAFIFVAFMIVDEETPSDVRASAQNLFNLVIVGIGIIVGSWFATSIVAELAQVGVLDAGGAPVLGGDGQPVTETDYRTLFSVPMWISLACLAALLAFYPRRSAAHGETETGG